MHRYKFLRHAAAVLAAAALLAAMVLAGLAAEASSTGREEVILSQKDRARYGKQVVTQANERLGDGHLTLSVQTRPERESGV